MIFGFRLNHMRINLVQLTVPEWPRLVYITNFSNRTKSVSRRISRINFYSHDTISPMTYVALFKFDILSFGLTPRLMVLKPNLFLKL